MFWIQNFSYTQSFQFNANELSILLDSVHVHCLDIHTPVRGMDPSGLSWWGTRFNEFLVSMEIKDKCKSLEVTVTWSCWWTSVLCGRQVKQLAIVAATNWPPPGKESRERVRERELALWREVERYGVEEWWKAEQKRFLLIESGACNILTAKYWIKPYKKQNAVQLIEPYMALEYLGYKINKT